MGNYRKDKLTVGYHKKQKDFVVSYPRPEDGHLIVNHLVGDVLKWGGILQKDKDPVNYEIFNLIKELDRRGYDTKTLKFEITLKQK